MVNLARNYNCKISYLRISVTDRCNLRCIYCMPEEGVKSLPHEEILTYEEIGRLVRWGVDWEISSIRITGGEPLVRKDIVKLVAALAEVEGIEDLALTTNGTLLNIFAKDLVKAGLKRVNVSLDTLKPERFEKITRTGNLSQVFKGIEAARLARLEPIKINMVVMRGINDDEVLDFAKLSIEENICVRFIELMPMGHKIWGERRYLPNNEVKSRLEILGRLEPIEGIRGSGPARYYRLNGSKGLIGFINPLSDHFCNSCNRLRLTAEGKLRSCLLSDSEVDLKTPLRTGASKETIRNLFIQAIRGKFEKHKLELQRMNGFMSRIGG